MRIIQGDTKPKAEQKHLYVLSSIIPDYTASILSQKKEVKYIWTLYKLVNNQWQQVKNNIKYGEKNNYQFGQGAVGIPFKIMIHSQEKDILQVNQNRLIAELTVVPKTAKEPVIGRVILLNKSNKDVNKAKFNEHLTAQARTSNLLGKEITFYLWEEGASEFEKYKNPKKGRVNKHGIAEVQFNLSEYASTGTFMDFFGGKNITKKFYVTAVYEGKGETNKTPVTATGEQKQTPKTTQTEAPQHPTQSPNNQGKGVIAKGAEIIAEGIGNIFNAIENTITATQVNQQPSTKEQDGTCPRCKKDFTWDEIKAIFGDSEKTFRMNCVNWINKYKLDFGINTCAKKAHFLSQIAAETHFREKEMAEGNVKYIPRNIRSSTFGDRGKLLDKRGQIEEFCNERPDQKKLFNFLYAKENGFGNGNGNEASGDGFNFRGKGLIQLTGKGNYKSAMGLIKEYVPTKIYTELITAEKRVKHFAEFEFEENRKQKTIKDVDLFDFVTYYDMPTEPKYAVLSALADWKGKGLSNSALMVNDVSKVIDIRRKINVGVKNLKVAEEYFKIAVTILQLDKCAPPSKNSKQTALETYDGKYKSTTKNAYIDVIVPSNRKKEGLLVFFDETKILHKCYVLGLGTGGEDRYTNGGYGNVPNGLWNTKLELDTPNTGVSFGNHGVIRLSPEAGDALKANSRSGILLHCGHTIGDGKKGLTDNGPLMVTHGCLRVYNADMPQITKIYSELIAKGKKIQIYIEEVSPEKLKDMFSFYGTVPDPKDANTNRKNKKDDAQ